MMKKVIEVCDDCGNEFKEGETEHFYDNFSAETIKSGLDLCKTCIRRRVVKTLVNVYER